MLCLGLLLGKVLHLLLLVHVDLATEATHKLELLDLLRELLVHHLIASLLVDLLQESLSHGRRESLVGDVLDLLLVLRGDSILDAPSLSAYQQLKLLILLVEHLKIVLSALDHILELKEYHQLLVDGTEHA